MGLGTCPRCGALVSDATGCFDCYPLAEGYVEINNIYHQYRTVEQRNLLQARCEASESRSCSCPLGSVGIHQYECPER